MSWEVAKWLCAGALGSWAAILAWRRTEGWGWFLFVAFVVAMSGGTSP